MRDIKFRTYIYDLSDGNNRNKSGYCMISGNNKMCLEYMEKGFPLMQYIGLKDKNGVEIYEGDIVRHVNDPGELDNGERELSTVVFHLGSFTLAQRDSYKTQLCFYEDDEVEVIGNIYENPELLEKL